MKEKGTAHAWTMEGRDRDALAAHVRISDSGLQKLVQGMYDRGWSLMSDELPQPNDGNRVRFDGRTVVYRARFVNQISQ